jgi:hypothetical protein
VLLLDQAEERECALLGSLISNRGANSSEEVKHMDEPKASEPPLILALVAAILCSLFLSGCGGMEITEQMPQAPLSKATETNDSLPAEHDLAILAIDFNPPLDYKDLWAEVGEVTLLIAVENRGLTQEQNVEVSASLGAPRRSETLLRQSTTLKALAPGEVQVVCFGGISNVPYRSAYRLEVQVSPAAEESILANNVKIYDLTIKEPPQAAASNVTSPLRGP